MMPDYLPDDAMSEAAAFRDQKTYNDLLEIEDEGRDSTLWPRDQSERKCSAETRGCEGWKRCSAESRFCEEDPDGQAGTCIRIPTSCGWVFH